MQTVAVVGLSTRLDGCGRGADSVIRTVKHSLFSMTLSATVSMNTHCWTGLESENVKVSLSLPKSSGAVSVC